MRKLIFTLIILFSALTLYAETNVIDANVISFEVCENKPLSYHDALLSSRDSIITNILGYFTQGYQPISVKVSNSIAGAILITNITAENFELVYTGGYLDLAILGEGYFALRHTNGEIVYTRRSEFVRRISDGKVITKDGHRLYPELMLPDTKEFGVPKIEHDGTVIWHTYNIQSEVKVEPVRVYIFSNASALKRTRDGFYKTTHRSGKAYENGTNTNAVKIYQGFTLAPTIDVYKEMALWLKNIYLRKSIIVSDGPESAMPLIEHELAVYNEVRSLLAEYEAHEDEESEIIITMDEGEKKAPQRKSRRAKKLFSTRIKFFIDTLVY